MDVSNSSSTQNPDALDEATQVAMAQATGQGSASSSSPTPQSVQPPQNREVGTIKQELVDRPLEDIGQELSRLFSLSELLGIENPSDTPEQKAKKQQMLQNFNQLSQEDQAVAQRVYQERMQLQQQKDDELMARNQREQAARANSITPPSGPHTGASDHNSNSKSQMAMKKLKDDRTKSGTLQSAN